MDAKQALFFQKRLEGIVASHLTLKSLSKHGDLSDLPDEKHQEFIVSAMAAVVAITGPHSEYTKQADMCRNRAGVFPGDRVNEIAGVVAALLSDLKAGYLKSLAEAVRGDLFADFLEMAEHLLDENYKDAGAVIGGSSLEAHLRALCVAAGIPTEAMTGGQMKPKKADTINAELAKAGVYGKLDQKNVTAWLDLRNHAAHGHYGNYTLEQVRLMLAGIRDFIARLPA